MDSVSTQMIPTDRAALSGGGEAGALVRACDWSSTALGASAEWSPVLRTALAMCLGSAGVNAVFWGRDFRLFYNDGYRPFLGDRHPWAMGRPMAEVWPTMWQTLCAPAQAVMDTGEGIVAEDQRLLMERGAGVVESFWYYSFTPICGEAGEVEGIFLTGLDTTARVIADRTQTFRLGLEAQLHDLADPAAVVATASEALGRHLDVAQVAYAQVEPDGETVLIGRDWNTGRMAGNVRRHQLSDYGPDLIHTLRGGEAVAIADVRLDPRTALPGALAAFAEARVAGLLGVPVVKGGALVAILGLYSDRPRAWTGDEIALAGEVAERTWVAAERARAERARHDADEALRASEEFNRRVLDSSADCIKVLDLNGRLTFMSEGGMDVMEVDDAASVLGSYWPDFWAGEERDLAVQALIAAQAGQAARFTGFATTMKDTPRWWDVAVTPILGADGLPERLLTVSRDITSMRTAERQLRQFNDSLERQVADRTADRDRMWRLSTDIMLVARFDGTITAVNPAWTTTLGWDSDELIESNFLNLVHPDDRAQTLGEMGKLDQGITIFRFENRYRGSDGAFRRISWTAVPGDDLIHAVGRDITDESAQAEALRTAEEALLQSQKMEAMGQLTGGVAHDFNNLLTPIVGSLDLLQRKGVGGEREQRLIAGAIQSADRARTLVQRLLAFARRQPLQPIAVDIGRLVEGMADLLASTTGPQVRVVVDVAADLPPAKADPNQLEMALLNLGVNARDAMPDGGTLRISATRESVPAPRDTLKRGHYVRLSVADTGSGMDAATLARAIEPFFSTKGIGKGTGLGLSMAHGLAAQLGGALTIQSRLEVGTNIELWLPISATALELEIETAKSAPLGHERGVVLLVDDEEVVRASTADMLEDLGYVVHQANSAEAALTLVTGGLTPDLLVSDHLMPGMSGVDLADRLRDIHVGLPVLIVSGYAEAEGIAPHLPRITKPFRSAELEAGLAGLDIRQR